MSSTTPLVSRAGKLPTTTTKEPTTKEPTTVPNSPEDELAASILCGLKRPREGSPVEDAAAAVLPSDDPEEDEAFRNLIRDLKRLKRERSATITPLEYVCEECGDKISLDESFSYPSLCRECRACPKAAPAASDP